MIPVVRDLRVVVADTGPFCRFAETNTLQVMRGYFDDRIVVVRDVHTELFESRVTRPEHKALEQLRQVEPRWPYGEPAELDDQQTRDVIQIAGRWNERERQRRERGGERDPYVHPRKNFGEVATAIYAQDNKLVAWIDDGKGQDFARSKGVTVITTEQVLAEMVAAGALRPRLGELVYLRVRKQNTRQQYATDVAAAQAALRAAGHLD